MIAPTPRPQLPPPQPQRRRIATQLLLGIGLLMLCGAAWILSLYNVISSLWASIFSAVFTILGVLLSLVQAHLQSSSEPMSSSVTPSLERRQVRISRQILVEDGRLGVNRQKGAVIIYTGKRLRGSTISLCKGFHPNLVNVLEATNVVERTINGVEGFVGIFPALEPGNYTVFGKNQKFVAMISVHASYVAEVDWR